MLPAWIWIQNPKAQFLYASHSLDFARRDSLYCNRLISSDWYQRLWGDTVRMTRNVNNIDKFELTAGGIRQIVSVGASVTGKNADYIIIDDPNDVVQSQSEVIRQKTNSWWVEAASSRFNDLRHTRQMIIQQRVHEDDLTGHILAKQLPNVTRLFLPAEYEPENPCRTGSLRRLSGKSWEDPRTERGELLWPSYVNAEVLKRIKDSLSPYGYAAQYQQRPAPMEGGILKKEWFRWWCEDQLPTCTYILQSWDTAYSGLDKTKVSRDKTICYSACTTWGIFEDEYHVPQVILLHSWQGKVEFPELRRKTQEFANQSFDPSGQKPHQILIEAKASGLCLFQDVRLLGVMATQFNPNPYGNKDMRARRITHLIEAGRVWVPAQPPSFRALKPFAHQFVECCALFPNGLDKDLIDSASQALIKLSQGDWFYHPEDDRPRPQYPVNGKHQRLY